jgi:hypothetical protein
VEKCTKYLIFQKEEKTKKRKEKKTMALMSHMEMNLLLTPYIYIYTIFNFILFSEGI